MKNIALERGSVRCVLSYSGEDKYALGISDGTNTPLVINGTFEELQAKLDSKMPEFLEKIRRSDLVIAKGQANYETLSDRLDQNIYFMLITKCKVIANDIGVPERSLVCLNHPNKEVPNL